jgi:hypothetical protein
MTDAEVALRYVDYLRTGDEDILESAFAPSFHDHVSGRTGPDMMRVVHRWISETLADISYEVHGVTAGDGLAMVWFSSRGRHVGSAFPLFADREPTGREIVAEAVHIFRVTDGKLSEHWAVRDDLGVLRQLDGVEAGSDRPRR